MSFAALVLAFSERFLSERTFELIVAPALADFEFDPGRRPLGRLARRLAVVRAVTGGARQELTRQSGSFFALTLLPTCYYLALLVVCFDSFRNWTTLLTIAGVIMALSLCPVMACFWPAPRTRVN